MIWIIEAALPHLPPDSTIVNTASINAYDPGEDIIDYAATKAASASLTKSLSKQLTPKGIRINAVAPGPIYRIGVPAAFEAGTRHAPLSPSHPRQQLLTRSLTPCRSVSVQQRSKIERCLAGRTPQTPPEADLRERLRSGGQVRRLVASAAGTR